MKGGGNMKYEWKVQGVWKQDANIVGHELEELASSNNLCPETVLEKAKDLNNPLHNLFEWDDSVAAEKYRLGQARQIIQQIVIVNDNPNTENKSVRAFVTTSNNDCHYQTITTVIQDPEAYEVLLARAKMELRAFKEKYKNLVEFKELFDELDKFL